MEKTDVVIIGGGIIGVSVADQLTRAGWQVTLLERREIASGASGGNFGMLSLYERGEPWHWPMVFETMDCFSQLQQVADIGLDTCGGTIAAANEAELQKAHAMFRPLEGTRVEFRTYTGADVRNIEPALDAYGIVHFPQEGKLDPIQTTLHLCERSREQGMKLFLRRSVTGFGVCGHRVTKVQTDHGDIETKWVVNAAGSWASAVSAMLGHESPVRFHKGTAMVSQPVPPLLRGTVVGGFLTRDEGLGENSSIVTATGQSKEGSMLIAQATQNSLLEDRDSSMEGLALVARKYLSFFPALDSLDIIRSWAAVTPYTEDGLPVFGFHRGLENVLTAAGFRGAFSTAPAIGAQVVRVLHGKDSHLLRDGFSPDRNNS